MFKKIKEIWKGVDYMAKIVIKLLLKILYFNKIVLKIMEVLSMGIILIALLLKIQTL